MLRWCCDGFVADCRRPAEVLGTRPVKTSEPAGGSLRLRRKACLEASSSEMATCSWASTPTTPFATSTSRASATPTRRWATSAGRASSSTASSRGSRIRRWERHLGYAEDSLVTDVTLTHPRLGITVKFEDFVDLARNWFIRNVEVVERRRASPPAASSSTTTGTSRARTSATRSPTTRAIAAVIAYKANRYFLVGGDAGPELRHRHLGQRQEGQRRRRHLGRRGGRRARQEPDRAGLGRLHGRLRPRRRPRPASRAR